MLKINDIAIDYLDTEVQIVSIGTLTEIYDVLENLKGKQFRDEEEKDLHSDFEDLNPTEQYYLTKVIKYFEDDTCIGQHWVYPVEYDYSSYWGLDLKNTIDFQI